MSSTIPTVDAPTPSTDGVPALLDDDESWASPRAKAGPRIKVVAGLLTALLVGTIGFSVGANVGKDRAAGNGGVVNRNALAQALGRNGGGFGGFGALGGQGGATPTTAAGTGDAAADTATATTADPGLGGLLPGLDAGPDAAAPTDSTVPATVVSGAVTAIDGATLTITDEAGTAHKVLVGDATVVERNGIAGLSAIAIGAPVTSEGTAGTDGTITATRLTVL